MGQLILQPDAAAGIDTYLDANNPAANYGDSTKWFVGGGYFDPAQYRQLVKFDLTGIPAEAVVNSVTLQIWQYTAYGSGTFNINRILAANASWGEGTATWNKRDGVNDWAGTAGCRTSGTDFASSPLYSGPTSLATNTWVPIPFNLTEFALMRAANYGFIFWGATITGGFALNPLRYAYSSDANNESGGESLRPRLTIEWVTRPRIDASLASASPLLGAIA